MMEDYIKECIFKVIMEFIMQLFKLMVTLYYTKEINLLLKMQFGHQTPMVKECNLIT